MKLPEEVVIDIAEDGSIKLNDKEVPFGDLEAKSWGSCETRGKKDKRKVLATLQTEEKGEVRAHCGSDERS